MTCEPAFGSQCFVEGVDGSAGFHCFDFFDLVSARGEQESAKKMPTCVFLLL